MIDSNNLTENQKTFLYWMRERDTIRVKKEAGLPKPWTNDKILQQFKFCNVEREQDRVSIWIRENWREPYMTHPNLWFAMVVARLFNWPPTLETIGFPMCSRGEGFDFWKSNVRAMLKFGRNNGKKIFTGAYLVSTNGVSMDKIDYILDRILTPIWEKGHSPEVLFRDKFPNEEGHMTLQEYWKYLTQFDGLGSFMAGQVVADLKYTPLLDRASDWHSFAPLGPGSKRGLNRFYGRPLEKGINQAQALIEFNEIRELVKEVLDWELPVHDIQNCCCETDKYIRIKNGEGKTRSTYPGV